MSSAAGGASSLPPLTRPAAIVFDFDGVLLESAELKTEAFAELFADHPELPKILEYHQQHTGLSRFAKFDWIFAELEKRELTAEESRRLGSEFSRLAERRIRACPLVPGAGEALSTLSGRYPLYIASGTPQAELEATVERRRLGGYFESLHGAPSAKCETLESIARDVGVQPRAIWMVGDGLSDHEAACAARTSFVLRETAAQKALFRDLDVHRVADMHGLLDLLRDVDTGLGT